MHDLNTIQKLNTQQDTKRQAAIDKVAIALYYTAEPHQMPAFSHAAPNTQARYRLLASAAIRAYEGESVV